MEENKKEHTYRAWKWILAVCVVLAAFGAGFFCGRFSAFFGIGRYGSYGYFMGPWMMSGGYGYPSGYGAPQPQTVPPPNATATPAPYYYNYGPGGMMRYMWNYYYPQATSTQ
ncbi:MAG: hypothetical protein KGJ13_03930 [Patescibacteria group bacterium]|nr:hypothetical protein [Patescibacteria group bacterium]